MRAAPGSPPEPGCSPLATPCGAEPASFMQHLNPLLAVPGGQHVQWAMGCILAALVDVPVQAGQHHTPRAVPWKFWPPAPPKMPHHRLPTRGAQDGGHHSHSAGTGHPACPSSLTHAAAQCIAVWRGTESCKLQRSSHPCLIATSLGRIHKIACQECIAASWASTHYTTHPHGMVAGCMVGVLNVGMHASLPPNALLFHSPSMAREKVLPIHLVKITSNLQATSVNIK